MSSTRFSGRVEPQRREETPRRFRCGIVGEGTLPLQCGELLLGRGHHVVALIGRDAAAARWAEAHGVEVIGHAAELPSRLGGRDVDYLFSIVNPTVLGDDVLSIPRLGAVNYHDSPLPRYAGVNATTWAIMAGETRHAVTWHEIASRVDAGRVLKAHPVDISETDTALTLNTKCYEAAVVAFGELLAELEEGRVAPREQDLTQRSYFGRYKRPGAACSIEWDQPAAAVDAFVRALNFGSYPNPIGRPKLFVGRAVLTCGEARRLPESAAGARPGTVVRADADALVVAARDALVAVRGIATLEGEPVSVGDLVTRGEVRCGDILPVPAGERAERITTLDAAAARAETFWRERLASVRPAVVPGATSGGVREGDTHTGEAGRARLPVHLPPRFGERIGAGDNAGALTALLAVYLARLGNDTPFDIGVSSAGCRAAVGDAGPLFAIQQPLRVSPDLSSPMSHVARAVAVGLDDLAGRATFTRDLVSRDPAVWTGPFRRWACGFPVSVVLDPHNNSDAGGQGSVLTLLAPAEGDGGATLVFDTAALDRERAQDIVGHLETLACDAVARPDVAAGELVLLPERELRRILYEWNATDAPGREGEFVHLRFAECAARTPDAVAVSIGGRHLTYGELEARSNQLAWELRALGVGPDVPVGVCLERSHELLIGMLGILKAGGAYVPLDPDHPAERLTFVMGDAMPGVVVTTELLRRVLPEHPAPVVSLDGDAGRLSARPHAAAPPPLVGAEHLAYIMYTSGSTGRPKGVMLSHGALGGFIRWARAHLRISASDTVLQRTPISFDPSGLEMYTALTAGARLVLARPGAHNDLAEVLELMRRERVTAAVFIPSVLAASAELPEFGAGCASLRVAISGGEALTGELAERLHAIAPGVTVYNMYGPTEAAIAAVTWAVPRGIGGGPLPIGRPVDNVRAYVLDGRLRPVPAGVAGELCLGGVQVARGYLNRPELTAEKFVPDPFTPVSGSLPSARMYRTGDLARWRPDGVLEFLGRADDQVKVRGFRVELGEVQTVLAGHPAVAECAVVRRGDGAHARLVAYVVPSAGNVPEPGALRRWAQERLPPYMVPSAFVPLGALPLTANGKLDQRALPEPEHAGHAELPYVAPRTPTEVVIADVWATVLGRDRIGVEEDFFEGGGNSLLGTRVLAHVGERTGVKLPLRTLFSAPTVARLAELVDDSRASGGATTAPTEGPSASGRAEAPLSFAQELLWMLDRVHPGLPAYNLPEVFRISGEIDADALGAAFAALVGRHPSLRTAFFATDAGAVQRTAERVEAPLPVVDLRALEPDEREREARRVVSEEVRRPFDLSRAPLIRAMLVRLGEEEWLFSLTHHHIVSDGWSRSILLGELGELYASRRGLPARELPPVPLRYTDYAAWQRSHLTGETLQSVIRYWRDELAGAADALALPTDHPRPPVRAFEGRVRNALWPASLRDDAKQFGQRHGATLFMTLFAAFQAVLGRYSGQDDFVIGTPVAGRGHSSTEGVVGYFANMLPLRTDLGGDPTFGELVDRVRERCLGAFEHEDVPFEALVLDAQHGAAHGTRPSHAPVFQVMFALQNTAPAELGLAGAAVRREDVDNGAAKYDLWLTATERADGLHVSVEFRTDLFEGETIDRLLGHVRTLLQSALRDPARPVSALPLLTAGECATLAAWNATDTVFPAGRCVHTLVEEQAARTPDAVAVAYENDRMTYRELDERANQLAHHLVAHGATPGERVGLCVERSPELVVALLAVLKTGAAYVPLDPGYPADRLALMVRDSGMRLLVAQEKLVGLLAGFEGEVVCVDRDRAAVAARPRTSPATAPGVSPDAVAYVIYTSGSTGVPKGAVLPHRAVVNYLQWMQSAYALDERDALLQKAPVSFDASVLELYLPLVAGARLVLARPDGHRDPLYLLGTIATQHVTVVQFVPSLLAAMLETPGFAAACQRLRLLFLGGEALPAELAARVRGLLPSVAMHNLYGPTEAAVYATAYPVPDECAPGVVPIGRPIANVQVHLLSGGGREPVPVGVPGELYIGGAGVGLGYLNRAELTAERFLPDPFRPGPGGLLYRTGDLARWRRDGVLEFLGRVDDQVKVRGFRVELGEVEAALARHRAVRECAVVRRSSGRGGDRLVGYVVPKTAEAPSATELRGFLSETLPDYMIPSAFVTLGALPLGVTGKLDRRALPDPVDDDASRPYTAPRTETERTVAAVWTEVLGRERVGADDDFFDSGGHSLLGMRVVLRLGQLLHVDLPLRLLFESRTVAALAAAIDHERAGPADTEIEQMLAALEQLSDEEAERLLSGNSSEVHTS